MRYSQCILFSSHMRERLHYAMDAEFIKAGGLVMARSVAFVPFVALVPIWDNYPNASVGATVTDVYCSSDGGSKTVDPIMQLTKGKHQTLIGSAPRGTAARALRRAKDLSSVSAPHTPIMHDTTGLANDKSKPRDIKECLSNSNQAPSSLVTPQIQRLSKDIQAAGLRTIVIALKADRVMEEGDVLPCGHALEYLSRGRVPACADSIRGESNAIWAPHNAYIALMNRVHNGMQGDGAFTGSASNNPKDDNNLPSSFDYPNQLDPYSIPSVLRHEGLLRKLYKAALKRCEESLLEGDKNDEFDVLVTECTKIFQHVSSKPFHLFRSRKGFDIFFSALAAECEIARAKRLITKQPIPVSVDDVPSKQQFVVRPNSLEASSLNRSVPRHLRGSGAGCLMSRFPSEESFIRYLYNCCESVKWTLTSTEKRYAPYEGVSYFSNSTTESDVCGPVNCTDSSTHTLVDRAKSPSPRVVAAGNELPHITFICDNMVELAVVLSCVWKYLMDLDESQARGNLVMSLDGIVGQCGAHPTTEISNSANYFFSYANFDTQVVHTTLGLLEGQGGSGHISDATIEEICMKHQLKEKLHGSYGKNNNCDSVDKKDICSSHSINHSIADISSNNRMPLLSSKFYVSIKDITADTLFRTCFLRSGKNVPKLTEAVEKVASISDSAKRLLDCDTIDPHNPLWDAAALASICSFLMKPPS